MESKKCRVEWSNTIFKSGYDETGLKYIEMETKLWSNRFTFSQEDGKCMVSILEPKTLDVAVEMTADFNKRYTIIRNGVWKSYKLDDTIDIFLVRKDNGDYFFFIMGEK